MIHIKEAILKYLPPHVRKRLSAMRHALIGKRIIDIKYNILPTQKFQFQEIVEMKPFIGKKSGDFTAKAYIFKNIICFPSFVLFYDLAKSLAFIPRRYKIKQTMLAEEFYIFARVNKIRSHMKIQKKHLKKSNEIEAGINFLGSFNNYWHFLIEQAPKIIIAEQLKIDNDIPILIPEDLYSSLYEIVELLNDNRRKIIKMGPNCEKTEPTYTKIKKLYDIGDHIINPYHTVDENLKPDVAINLAPIQDMVKQVFSHYEIKPKADKNIKLFLRRNSNYRISPDQDKLQDFAVKNGFQIFEPEKHSFKQQVAICSKASLFLGFSGAGCANAIFLPKNAKKIILISRTNMAMALIKLSKQFLSSSDFIFTDFKPEYKGDIHGSPFLTARNWDDLHKIISEEKIL